MFSFKIQLYSIRGILETFSTFCCPWIYQMSQRSHHSVWHVGVKVQGRSYKVYWNIIANLWASQVRHSPTTSILPVGVKSASVPWTFHTCRTCAFIAMFWIYICRLVGIEAEKYLTIECSLDMKSIWVKHVRDRAHLK